MMTVCDIRLNEKGVLRGLGKCLVYCLREGCMFVGYWDGKCWFYLGGGGVFRVNEKKRLLRWWSILELEWDLRGKESKLDCLFLLLCGC